MDRADRQCNLLIKQQHYRGANLNLIIIHFINGLLQQMGVDIFKNVSIDMLQRAYSIVEKRIEDFSTSSYAIYEELSAYIPEAQNVLRLAMFMISFIFMYVACNAIKRGVKMTLKYLRKLLALCSLSMQLWGTISLAKHSSLEPYKNTFVSLVKEIIFYALDALMKIKMELPKIPEMSELQEILAANLDFAIDSLKQIDLKSMYNDVVRVKFNAGTLLLPPKPLATSFFWSPSKDQIREYYVSATFSSIMVLCVSVVIIQGLYVSTKKTWNVVVDYSRLEERAESLFTAMDKDFEDMLLASVLSS